jgi:predicted Zn-dependent protease
LVTILAGELIKSDVGKQAAQVGTVLSATAIASGYSRDHEDQADRVGLRYAFQAGFNVNKGPRLRKRFSYKYGDQSKVKNLFFGDHSRASVRAALLREEIKHNHYKQPKTAAAATK